MGRNKRGPALYELIRDRSRPESRAPVEHAAPTRSTPTETDDDVRAPAWLSPGRTVRVPMGYFFFAIGLVLIVGWGGYAIGYRHAERTWEANRKRDAAAQLNELRDPILDAPLNTGLITPNEQSDQNTNDVERETDPPKPTPAPATLANRQLSSGVYLVEEIGGPGEPRTRGMNYYQLMSSPNREEVMRAAEFLVDNGIEVAMITVRRNNSRPSYTIQALKPFPGSTLRGAEASRYMDQLKQLGRVYKKDHRGVDFESTLAVKFN